MTPYNKCCTFLNHNPVSVDRLYCTQASGPKFWLGNNFICPMKRLRAEARTLPPQESLKMIDSNKPYMAVGVCEWFKARQSYYAHLSARGVSGCQDVWPLIDSNRQCSGQLEGLARGFPKGMEKWEREPPGEIPKIFKGTSSHHIPSPPQNLPQKSFTNEVTEIHTLLCI